MPKEYPTYTRAKTGETKTLSEWAKETGIAISTLSCRIKRGMNIDEAIEASISPKKNRTDNITDPVSGETHSVHEWASIVGIDENTLYHRLFKYKWPIDKALYEEKSKKVNYKPRPKESYNHIDLTGQRYGNLIVIGGLSGPLPIIFNFYYFRLDIIIVNKKDKYVLSNSNT